MAVYKVIQDIEAEDKLLGPLTLKGFIYAAIAVLFGFMEFRMLIAVALGPIKWLFIFIFFFPMVLFAVLASPLGREQPTEIWLLARIRYFLKPRERIWSQLGINELVKVTAPKKQDLHLTKDLSKDEVTSRLQALAQTLDSHGWAAKNAIVNVSPISNYLAATANTDRLVARPALSQPQPVIDVHPADDILDAENNPDAQKVETMMREAEETRKMEMQLKLQEAKHATILADHSRPDFKTDDQQKLLDQMHQRAKIYESQEGASADSSVVTPATQTVNMELAQSGSAFSVATIANLANRGGSEVVVPLH